LRVCHNHFWTFEVIGAVCTLNFKDCGVIVLSSLEIILK